MYMYMYSSSTQDILGVMGNGYSKSFVSIVTSTVYMYIYMYMIYMQGVTC